MIPTSSKLLMMVMAGLEASDPHLPDFDRIQEAVKYGESQMPMIKNAGLVSTTHELEQLIQQTVDLGYMEKYEGRYMLTETGKNVMAGITDNGNI